MTEKQTRVLIGYKNLQVGDRDEVKEQIKKIDDVSYHDETLILEAMAKRAGIDLGPINSGGCPCCGK